MRAPPRRGSRIMRPWLALGLDILPYDGPGAALPNAMGFWWPLLCELGPERSMGVLLAAVRAALVSAREAADFYEFVFGPPMLGGDPEHE